MSLTLSQFSYQVIFSGEWNNPSTSLDNCGQGYRMDRIVQLSERQGETEIDEGIIENTFGNLINIILIIF